MKAALTTAQMRFQDHLLDPTHNLDDLIADSGRASRETRLAIYTNAYRVRMVEAAAADYAQLRNYLGDASFEELIHAYLHENPSRHSNLRWFGERLSEFLKTSEPYASHPDLHEMAVFEWALCGAFDAADAEPLQLADLAGLTPEGWAALRPVFHPSLRCIALRGNLPDIWEALNEECDPPPLQFAEAPVHWLVWRKELRLMYRPMSIDEQQCLQWFLAGADVGGVCERLAGQLAPELVPAHVAGLLGRWVSDALLVDGTPKSAP
jgi:hypothetical protein